MPTLRRSKSLNDKASRQKNRVGDVIRDPRSQDGSGGESRTRTCLDNYQLLVHLKKQNDDKSRQLELAFTYGSTLTHIPQVLAHRTPQGRPWSELHPPVSSTLRGPPPPPPPPQPQQHPTPNNHQPDQPIPYPKQHGQGVTLTGNNAPSVYRRGPQAAAFQHGGEEKRSPRPVSMLPAGDPKNVVSQETCSRPVSMFEARGPAGPGLGLGHGPGLAGAERVCSKDQTIQNLLQSQRLVTGHNQRLLSKVEELEAENARLRAVLRANGIPHNATPTSISNKQKHTGGGGFSSAALHHLPVSESFTQLSGNVSGASSAPMSPEDPTGSSSSEALPRMVSTLKSPISETSVSGYGSLGGSAYGGEGTTTITLEGRAGGDGIGSGGDRSGGGRSQPLTPMSEVGGCFTEDDTLPLSEASGERLGSDSTLPSSLSSGAGDTSSHDPTFSRQQSVYLESLNKKMDRLMELGMERQRGSERKDRIVDLERQVAELTEEWRSVLERYKDMVQYNEKLQMREEQAHNELSTFLHQHGQSLERSLLSQLHHIHHDLRTLASDVRGQLEVALASLTSSSSSSSPSSSLASASPEHGARREQGGGGDAVPSEVEVMMEKVVDLIGPEYMRLGRRLRLPQLELERIEAGTEDFAHKTRTILRSWLTRRKVLAEEEEEERYGAGRDGGCSRGMSPAQDLSLALRDIDKDVRLLNQIPISIPEREALRHCRQAAIDHVTNPGDLFDHMIGLNELTPVAIIFVQEVLSEHPERALARLWHVLEYRGQGVLSRLALGLERAGHPHVSNLLTEELEIQNARFQSRQYHHLCHEDPTHAPELASHCLGSRPSPSPHNARSRPKSSQGRSRTTALECHLGSEAFMPLHDQEEVVWDRRAPRPVPVEESPRRLLQGQKSRVTKV